MMILTICGWLVVLTAVYGLLIPTIDHPGARLVWSIFWPVTLVVAAARGIGAMVEDAFLSL